MKPIKCICGRQPEFVVEWKYGERSQVVCSCGISGPKELPERADRALKGWNTLMKVSK